MSDSEVEYPFSFTRFKFHSWLTLVAILLLSGSRTVLSAWDNEQECLETCDMYSQNDKGTCSVNSNGIWECDCDDGYIGLYCDVNRELDCQDACENPKASPAVCNQQSEYVWTCECADGYSGGDCSIVDAQVTCQDACKNPNGSPA
eukprot:254676_1